MTILRLTNRLRCATGPSYTALPIASRRAALPPRRHSPGSQQAARLKSSDAGVVDGLATGSVKGRTGGGKPLESSSEHAPPKPKITNQSVPGSKATLSEEQQREVDEHNRDFDAKHDRGERAPDDKVDKKFWRG